MKKIALHIFLIISLFFHSLNLRGHNTVSFNSNIFSNIQCFIKDYSTLLMASGIGICVLAMFSYMQYKKNNSSKEKTKAEIEEEKIQAQLAKKANHFWFISVDNNEKFSVDSIEVTKYPLLNYYITHFGYANSEKYPLKIGCKEKLDTLLEKKIEDPWFTIECNRDVSQTDNFDKILEYAFSIADHLPIEVDIRIAGFLQQLRENSALSFVTSQLLYHSVRLTADFRRKHFFNCKNFFWRKDDNGTRVPTIYDQDGNKIFKVTWEFSTIFDNGTLFAAADNATVIVCYKYNKGLLIYDLETKDQVKIDVNLDMLTISPNGQYIAYNSGNDFIEMYDISGKIIRLVARLQHQRVGDIAFSPCGSKIASCSDDQQVGEVILWDLKDIENITKEILLSNIECGRIFFSADGENISVTDSQGDHSSSNTFRDRIVTLLNINTKAIKKLSPYYYYKTQIFPDKSSLIKRETYDHENRRYTTTIVDKNGEERAIFSEHTHAPSINKNYILACHEGRGKLFDHTMNCITQFSYGNPQNKIIRFKLYKEDSIKENVIYGRLSWSTGRKTDEAFYWQIPTETTMETVKSINKSLTTQQLLCLEAICSQKRFPKQHLLLKGDIRKSFLSFNAAKQEFLKTQLLVIY